MIRSGVRLFHSLSQARISGADVERQSIGLSCVYGPDARGLRRWRAVHSRLTESKKWTNKNSKPSS